MSFQTKIVITCHQDSLTIESGTRQIGLWAGCEFPDPEKGLKPPVTFEGQLAKHTIEKMLEDVGGLGYINNALVNLMLAKAADAQSEMMEIYANEDEAMYQQMLNDCISVSFQLIG